MSNKDINTTILSKEEQATFDEVSDFIKRGSLSGTDAEYIGEQEENFLWRGGPMLGQVSAIVSAGGTGKSFWALQLAMTVASGGAADFTGLSDMKYGKSIYIGLEDTAQATINRYNRILNVYDADRDARGMIGENISMIFGQKLEKNKINFSHSFVDKAVALALGADSTDLIILDTLSMAHSYEENSNPQMVELIESLKMIAEYTGATLMYLHHTSKAAALGGLGDLQQAARGASVLIDHVRHSCNLQTVTERLAKEIFEKDAIQTLDLQNNRYALLNTSKENFSHFGGGVLYKRGEHGVLVEAKGAVKLPQSIQYSNLKGQTNDAGKALNDKKEHVNGRARDAI